MIIPIQAEQRACKVCGETKPITEFYKHSSCKDGHRYDCKKCSMERAKKWQKANPEKHQLYMERVRAKKGAAYYREQQLKQYYGIDLAKYDEMLSAQRGCCAICSRHQSEFNVALAVDHCHETGAVRGLLCGSCNRMIGYTKDKVAVLDSAIQYLGESKYAHG